MQTVSKYSPSFVTTMLLIALVAISYPHLQYYIDSDATAYLTIAQRYADGDLMRAINGYWSPWSCWLTALIMKTGMAVFPAAISVNTVAAIGWLFITQSLFLLFGIERRLQWILNFTLAVFLAYAVYKQNFDDLWECLFLLSSVRVMLIERYILRQRLWVVCGVLGALAYFAKAYAFPFFILNMIVCHYFLSSGVHTGRPVSWVKTSFITFCVMMLCAIPWLFMLHSKYGIWTTSTAGTLNLSWYPAGHPYFKEGIKYLVPPVYNNSPSYWEDPWVANGIRPYFWSSAYMLLRQIVRIGYNILLLIKCLNEQSPFMLGAVALAIGIVTSAKARNYFGSNVFILSVTMLLFPLGFLPINYESRYIWFMLVPGIVLTALALQKILSHTTLRTAIAINLLFAFSFIAWPLLDIRSMWNSGRDQFDIAQQLKKQNIVGSFITNVKFSKPGFDEIQRIAYFSGNPYYVIPSENAPYKGILTDIKQYDIKYYLYYYSPGTPASSIALHNEEGKVYPIVASFNGLSVFLLQ